LRTISQFFSSPESSRNERPRPVEPLAVEPYGQPAVALLLDELEVP